MISPMGPLAADQPPPLVVVLPVHDEEATVADVIARVPPRVHARPVVVVVVDDGSTDSSAALSQQAGAMVVTHSQCRGLGAAVRTGFGVALQLDAWAVAFLDADGEYDPGELERVVAPLARDEADYVVGSRFRGKIESMRPHRRVGNLLLTWLTSLVAGRRLSDGQSGFRALGRAALAAADIEHDYNYAQVLTLDLLRKGYRYSEVPIHYRRRRHGRSFVRGGRYLRHVLPAMARVVARTRREGPQARAGGSRREGPQARAGGSRREGPQARRSGLIAVIETGLSGWRLPAAVFVAVLIAGQLAVGMRASAIAPINGDEPFYVITAQSLVTEQDLDLRDEYGSLEYWSWWQGKVPLWRQMTPAADGSLVSPHEPGLAVLVAPAFAVAGVKGIQRFLVVLWAAAMGCGAVLARRYRARPLAALTGGILVGVGAPGLVYASQIYPEGPAALAVAAALLICTGERARPRPLAFALTLVALAWLGIKYTAVGGLLAGAWAWRFRRDGRALAVATVVTAAAAVHYLWWHLETFGGVTPYSVNAVWSGQPDDVILTDHLDFKWRTYRLYGLFLDARFGLFRWLPGAIVGVWGVWRWRDGMRQLALLPSATFAVGVFVGTFASITIMGWWFPGRLLVAGFPALVVLIALGAERIPRTTAVLAAWSLAVAVALAWAARRGVVHLAVDPFNLGLPLPPAWLFPDFRHFGGPEIARSLLWGGVLLAAATRTGGRGRLRGRSPAPS